MHRGVVILALLAATALSLRTFSSGGELVQCIMKCEKPVTACLRTKRIDCVPPYHVCINGNDTYNCLINS